MALRKPKPLSELQTDPAYPFYVGRLVGAAEMASHWLQMQPGEQVQQMGDRLGWVVGWFLDEPNAPGPRSEPVTKAIQKP